MRVVFWRGVNLSPVCGMKVLAETDEFVLACDPRQPEPLCSLAIPLTQDLLALGVVVTDAQMFREVFLGVPQSVLCLGSKHGHLTTWMKDGCRSTGHAWLIHCSTCSQATALSESRTRD